MDAQNLACSLAAAIFATALTLFFVEAKLDREVNRRLAPKITALEAMAEQSRTEVERLAESIERVGHKSLSLSSPNPTNPVQGLVKDDSLKVRIEEIEYMLASLTEDTTKTSSDLGIGVAEALRVRVTQSRPGESPSYKRGEELFRSDYGSSMGNQEETLSSVFHGVDKSIGLNGVSCKSTICKVTYQLAGADGLSSAEINSTKDLLMNRISSGYDNTDLHIINGADEFGHQVMYIQTR